MTLQLCDFFRYYKQLPHQDAAIAELQAAIPSELLDRNAAWYKIWQAAGKHEDYGPALALIKQFEGCHLEAYADPLHGWKVPTIGFGTTRYPDGRKVEKGDKITVIEADQLLAGEVDKIAERLRATVPFWQAMAIEQRSALISFAYNLGAGFYGVAGFETISRRLKDKEWAKVPDALVLYRNPGTNVEAGLRRRREAEGKLWLQGMGMPAPPATSVRLKVPYEYQRDNASGQGDRECFSSSCAMIARFYGKVASDDAYNKVRAKFGDTTSAQAQVKALQSLGLKAAFTQSGDVALLERELRAGRPIAVGWLHHGYVSAPAGGGHWSVVVGMTPETFIHNDPYGEADMINGGYLSAKGGEGISYSRKNWIPRWRVDGTGGWAITVSVG